MCGLHKGHHTLICVSVQYEHPTVYHKNMTDSRCCMLERHKAVSTLNYLPPSKSQASKLEARFPKLH